MKSFASLLFIILSLSPIVGMGAGPSVTSYSQQQGFAANYYVTNYSGNVTNSVTDAWTVDMSLYHTFHFYVTSTNLNGFQYVIDKSLNGTNWVAGATNSIGSAAAGGVAEATITGKEYQFRIRTFSTNATVEIDYLGGR